jgi:hypothetical protein
MSELNPRHILIERMKSGKERPPSHSDPKAMKKWKKQKMGEMVEEMQADGEEELQKFNPTLYVSHINGTEIRVQGRLREEGGKTLVQVFTEKRRIKSKNGNKVHLVLGYEWLDVNGPLPDHVHAIPGKPGKLPQDRLKEVQIKYSEGPRSSQSDKDKRMDESVDEPERQPSQQDQENDNRMQRLEREKERLEREKEQVERENEELRRRVMELERENEQLKQMDDDIHESS